MQRLASLLSAARCAVQCSGLGGQQLTTSCMLPFRWAQQKYCNSELFRICNDVAARARQQAVVYTRQPDQMLHSGHAVTGHQPRELHAGEPQACRDRLG